MPDGAYNLKCAKGHKIAHINIHSLINKFDELCVLIKYTDVDILCITETWLDNNIYDNEITIENYDLFRKSELNVSIPDNIYHSERKALWLLIHPKFMSPFFICSLYRHLCENVEYLNSFIQHIEPLCNGKRNIIITGDFNLNLRSNDQTRLKPISEMCNLLGFEQLIEDYTRETSSSATLIII